VWAVAVVLAAAVMAGSAQAVTSPLPAKTGQYVIQIRVMDGDLPSGNQGLASAYSPLFTLRSGDRVASPELCTEG
jgi:hypothetical protein